MSVIVRKAVPEDAEQIAALNTDVQTLHREAEPWFFKSGAPDPEMFRSAMQKEQIHIFIATIDAEPVGYVFAELRAYPETPLTHPYKAVHVHHISVRSAFRRSGVGQALMAEIEATAKTLNADRISADTWAFNTPAREFFESHGLAPYLFRLWRPLA